jgi:phage terminase small subunit
VAERLLAPPVVCIDVARQPIETPSGLAPEVRKIFRETVASCDAQHFRKADIPLLVSYATATNLARCYASKLGVDATALRAWTEATKLQLSLARALRLTPSSRTDPKTIGRQQESSGRPWDPCGDYDDA